LTGGIDETFLRIEGASRHSFLADGNNNNVRLLDANQAKVVDYNYEPYGRTTADATNGNTQQYTGRENDNPGNAGGLYYYRARYYMPGCARFISEDPIGWASGQTNNYSYVGGNPLSFSDPTGLQAYVGQTPPASIPGGSWTPQAGQPPGTFQGPKNPGGPRKMCMFVPDEANGGPKGAKEAYWKTQEPGQKGWQRYNLEGKPITPEEAHPGNPRIPLRLPFYLLICPLCDIMHSPPPVIGPA
jgi:RHS repeat-associated protein